MRYFIILLLLLMCGCTVSVKESYRNPDFNQKLDKISIRWEPKENYKFTFTYKYFFEKSTEIHKATEHIKDIGKRYPTLLANELLYYDTDVVNKSESNYELITTTGEQIEVFCGKSGTCTPKVDIELRLKEKKSDIVAWTATISVKPSPPPHWEKNSDGKQVKITPDSIKDLAEAIVKEWDSNKFLTDRKYGPRKPPIGSLALAETSQPPSIGTPVKLKVSSGDTTNPNCIAKSDPEAAKIIDWFKQNSKFGSDSQLTKNIQKDIDSLDNVLQASWEVGSGLTRSGKAYRLEWSKNKLDIAELTSDEAFVKGIKESSIRHRIKQI